MKKSAILLTIFAFSILIGCKTTEQTRTKNVWKVFSPDRALAVNLEVKDNRLFYSVTKGASTYINESPLGLVTSKGTFDDNVQVSAQDSAQVVQEDYQMYTGKQKANSYKASSQKFLLKNEKGNEIGLEFMVFDDAVAFRYTVNDSLIVTKELTGFNLPEGEGWMQSYDSVTKWTPGYERYFEQVRIGDPSRYASGWCFPVLTKTSAGYALITESNLNSNYFGAHVKNVKGSRTFTIQQPDSLEAEGIGSVTAKMMKGSTPWRIIIASDSLVDIVQSNIVNHLADDPNGNNFAWVKPGRAAWSWWSEQGSPRDFNALKQFIDFSSSMGWEYFLVDANWNEMKGGNIEALAKYAQDKNVGLWLWYNSGGKHNKVTEQPRDIMADASLRKAEMQRIAKMGVKGIKVDFFQSDKQFIIAQYLDILKDAAENQIMVNFHGCTIPRGWSRTWPNLVSMESVRGAESYIFASDFPERAPLHHVHLAFTRNVIGPMDYTPVTFSDNKYPHITTNAHELALSVIFETGILHFADAAKSYQKQTDDIKEMLKVIPVTWDQTKLVEGDPNSHVVLARRSGEDWFVAGINVTTQGRDVTLPLDFIKAGDYDAKLVTDKKPRLFDYKTEQLTNASTLRIKLLPQGGFILHLRKR